MNRRFGLPMAELRDAVLAAVPGVEPTDEAVSERFARAAWSGIAEGGDGAAGALIAAAGAVRALELVLEGGPVAHDVESARALAAARTRWLPRLDSAAAVRHLVRAGEIGATLLVPDDAAWPSGLADLGPHAPIALWVRSPTGAPPALARSVALVGARAATTYGEGVAVDAAAGLADRDVVTVSGAAYGIDGAVHHATLVSAGTTVAVLAGGVDRYYPTGHATLLQRIAATGAVIAESPCGTAPTRFRFLQRNRLIAAMSGATVVLEAGIRSGSINTAGHAAALGRPLGAVPGSVRSAASAGCHRLLREYGAVCVRDAADIAELLLGGLEPEPIARGGDPEGLEQRVLDALGPRPRDVLEVARRSGLAQDEAGELLELLTLVGAAAAAPGGWTRSAVPVAGGPGPERGRRRSLP